MPFPRHQLIHGPVERERRQAVESEIRQIIGKIDRDPALSARFGTIRKTMAAIPAGQLPGANGKRLALLEKRVHSSHTTIKCAQGSFAHQSPI